MGEPERFRCPLTAGGIDFSLYGIWALLDALETDDGDVSSMLPAAVQWLRCAGPVLASLALNGALSDDGAAWLGPLCVNAGRMDLGYTARRWNFWKSRLEEIAAAGGESAGLAREGLRYLLAAGRPGPASRRPAVRPARRHASTTVPQRSHGWPGQESRPRCPDVGATHGSAQAGLGSFRDGIRRAP